MDQTGYEERCRIREARKSDRPRAPYNEHSESLEQHQERKTSSSILAALFPPPSGLIRDFSPELIAAGIDVKKIANVTAVDDNPYAPGLFVFQRHLNLAKDVSVAPLTLDGLVTIGFTQAGAESAIKRFAGKENDPELSLLSFAHLAAEALLTIPVSSRLK